MSLNIYEVWGGELKTKNYNLGTEKHCFESRATVPATTYGQPRYEPDQS